MDVKLIQILPHQIVVHVVTYVFFQMLLQVVRVEIALLLVAIQGIQIVMEIMQMVVKLIQILPQQIVEHVEPSVLFQMPFQVVRVEFALLLVAMRDMQIVMEVLQMVVKQIYKTPIVIVVRVGLYVHQEHLV